MSVYDEEMERIVASFLKERPESTVNEIAGGTGLERVDATYCLNTLQERGVVTVLDTRPHRWALR